MFNGCSNDGAIREKVQPPGMMPPNGKCNPKTVYLPNACLPRIDGQEDLRNLKNKARDLAAFWNLMINT